MKKIINMLFYLLKYILLLGSFGLTLLIIVQMNQRLGKSFTLTLHIFIPYIILFILSILNVILHQDRVNKNIFYNITSCLVFATAIWVGYRAMFDKNMVLNEKYGYGIDFNYYNNFIAYLKIMITGLCIGNIFFMFKEKKQKGE